MEIKNTINNEINEFESPNSEKDLKNIAKTLIQKYPNTFNWGCNVSAFIIEQYYNEFKDIQSKIKRSRSEDLKFKNTVDLTVYNLKEADFERITDIIHG